MIEGWESWVSAQPMVIRQHLLISEERMNGMNQATGLTSQGRLHMGLALCAVMLLSGCMVSKGQYEAAVVDMENAKTELEKNRMMREALEQENAKLKSQNEKITLDLELMSSEIQRIKEGRENERELLSAREAEVDKRGEILGAKLGTLQREYQKLKSQNRALRDTVRRYQKELKEARETKQKQMAKPETPVVPNTKKSSDPPMMASIPQPKPPTAPAVVATPPLKGSLAPVNINTASANDLVLFLGLTKDMAERVVGGRPYRLRGELVAKKVIPKATFDVIKDRITASSK